MRSWWVQGRWAKRAAEPRYLAGSTNAKRGGYRSVTLGRGNTRSIHGLVLTAFVGPRPDGLEVRHLNGNPSDNRLENLEWGTHDENHADRERHGTLNRGERAGGSKLTERQVVEIRTRAAAGALQRDLAAEFGVTHKAISKIVRRERWAHV